MKTGGKKKDNALLAGGILGGLAVLAYMFTRGDKKETTADGVKVSTSEGETSAWTPADGGTGGGPISGKQPFAIIDGSITTPGAFAVKYGGSFSRWKEIAAANPDLYLVDIPMPCRDGSTPANSGKPQCYGTAEKRADGQPVYVFPYQGIVPWQLGQQVFIPKTWPYWTA